MVRRQAKALRRSIDQIRPKKKFYLFCEGEKTEYFYFQRIRQIYDSALIDIQLSPKRGVPLTLVESAKQLLSDLRRQRRGAARTDSFEKDDEIWVVFDRDDHPGISDAFQKCEAVGIGVAYSNPCFEVWMILHYEDYNKPDNHTNVQRYFEKICSGYSRKTGKLPIIEDLQPRLADAERRAEAILKARSDEGQPLGRPSTTVHKLVVSIRKAAIKG